MTCTGGQVTRPHDEHREFSMLDVTEPAMSCYANMVAAPTIKANNRAICSVPGHQRGMKKERKTLQSSGCGRIGVAMDRYYVKPRGAGSASGWRFFWGNVSLGFQRLLRSGTGGPSFYLYVYKRSDGSPAVATLSLVTSSGLQCVCLLYLAFALLISLSVSRLHDECFPGLNCAASCPIAFACLILLSRAFPSFRRLVAGGSPC